MNTLRRSFAAIALLVAAALPCQDAPLTQIEKPLLWRIELPTPSYLYGTIHLPDDPADARGVLSHHRDVDPGSYGFLQDLSVDGDTLKQILQDASSLQIRFTVPSGDNANGFALFGETLGGYPVGPTLLFS